ncbi:hypothetical protein [Micromonospora maritima]|uniref:SPW repeat-containing protein n=1 Tax=Micromonospora maritima TaxID=986711 RepID=A0ABW7ZCV6_9ACTN
MGEQPPQAVRNAADEAVGQEDVPHKAPVSLRTALRRWAVGLAIGTLLVLAVSWFHTDGLLAILSALGFVYRRHDRRSRWAVGAAWLTAAPAVFAAAAVVKGWLPQPWDGVLLAGLGSFLGSISYAVVTRAGSRTPRTGR